MTARSVSDLAAGVRAAIRPRGPIAGESRLRQSERDKVAKATEGLAELVARLEAAEGDVRTAMGAAERFREQGVKDAARAEAAEAQVAALTQERDAARLVPPLIRTTLEKALRLDMTKPPVTRAELRAAIDLLPDSPSFYSSVSGIEHLAEAEARAEAAEAQVAALTQERDNLQHLFDERARFRDEWKARAEAAEAALADTRRALELAAHAFAQYALDTNDPPAQAVADFVDGFMQEAHSRRALAAADGGLTAPPMDLGGLVDDAEVANKIDRRAATGGGQEQQP